MAAQLGPVGAARALLEGEAPPGCEGARCARLAPEFAQWEEARRIRYGYGMTARAERAIRWYERSARQGDPRAMHNFGLMLSLRQGVDADIREAERWLQASLKYGIGESALALGNLARRGRAGAVDPAGAAVYYRQGAELGETRAMHALGNLYAAGSGLPRSIGEAYFWYYLAAKKGHVLAETARDAARTLLPGSARLVIEDRARDWITTRRSKPASSKK